MRTGGLERQGLNSRVPYKPCARSARWVATRSSVKPNMEGESSASSSAPGRTDTPGWWTNLNRKTGFKAPNQLQPKDPHSSTLREDLVGERVARRMEDLDKAERQRVWDAMRMTAANRYAAGEMPDWFDPAWLYVGEEPTNAMLRQETLPSSTGNGGHGGGDDAGGGGGAGGRRGTGGNGGDEEWQEPEEEGREDDPYWLLRESGCHPMFWSTLAFAAVLAGGGLLTTLASGYTEPLQLGWGAAALLVMGAAAMSAKDSLQGALGVKLAWAVCALLAAKEAAWGWQHQRRRSAARSAPRLGLSGMAALAMCLGYMLTDMSGCGDVALPTNPGAVFKSADVAYRSKVWSQWGYGQVQMRM